MPERIGDSLVYAPGEWPEGKNPFDKANWPAGAHQGGSRFRRRDDGRLEYFVEFHYAPAARKQRMARPGEGLKREESSDLKEQLP